MQTLLQLFLVGSFTFLTLLPASLWAAGQHTDVKVDSGTCAATLNDFSRSARYTSRSFQTPTNEADLANIVKNTKGTISVLGGGFSMGGQVASKNGVVIDMSKMNAVLAYNPGQKTIRVQAGATWRQIQEHIHRDQLAIKVMQTYSNFQVGGSLSVNVHGRYVGYGPVISSVREIRLLLADGQIVTANRQTHSELFYGAIGGYGALGVIVDATLDLADNEKLERTWQEFKTPKKGRLANTISEYVDHFRRDVLPADGQTDAVMTNADIYPPDYKLVRSITYRRTDKPLTILEHLQTPENRGWMRAYNALLHTIEQSINLVKRYRALVYERRNLEQEQVVYRNWEASYDASDLNPLNELFPIMRSIFDVSNRKSLLQEYFIPEDQLPDFVEKMRDVFLKYKVNVTNVSIRHVPQNSESMLSWSNKRSFALVIYYTQPYGANDAERRQHLADARMWTQEMLDRVLETGGSYYLPYQLYARTDQFRQAYPNHENFRQLKQRVDPTNKFSNHFVSTYILEKPTFHLRNVLESEFEMVDLRDFFRYVFNVIDPDQHIKGLRQAYRELLDAGIEPNDKNMYEKLLVVLPKYTGNPIASGVRAVTSLRSQQNEMAKQTAQLLAEVGRTDFNGYVEVGSTGRYVGYLKNALSLSGPTYVVNDVAPKLLSPTDILERTGGYGTLDPRSYTSLLLRSKFVDISACDQIEQSEIPNQSVDLVSVYIGLHHCPPHKLRAFVASLHRILRPGGMFVLRDHDANTEPRARMANLAHTTFNAGFGVPYTAEVTEIRNFQPLDYWINILKDSGFTLRTTNPILQEGDPSRNSLIAFEKTGAGDAIFAGAAGNIERAHARGDLAPLEPTTASLRSLDQYFRSKTHTHLVGPEWLWVDIYKEYAALQARVPWYKFPFTEFVQLAKKVYKDHTRYAQRSGVDDKKALKAYQNMDQQLILANGVLFWGLQKLATLTEWMLRNETPPQTTGFVVQGITPEQVAQFSEGLLKQVIQLQDGMTLLATQRQMPFTLAMIELAKQENVELLEVAGNTDINVLFASRSTQAIDGYRRETLSSLDLVSAYQYPLDISSNGEHVNMFNVKIHVRQLGQLLRLISEKDDLIMRVHDY